MTSTQDQRHIRQIGWQLDLHAQGRIKLGTLISNLKALASLIHDHEPWLADGEGKICALEEVYVTSLDQGALRIAEEGGKVLA